ncbi:MAG TPA: hypothetical protein VMV92_32575 [Streptosporangiaceae bacterium]|nr:hypothetical protein [Streptosporangiaceae bacterium]
MAKSNRRKKQDRAKAEVRRAEQSRLRARAGRQQQLADRYSRLLDPQSSPAEVAELLAAALPDSIAAGAMVQTRMSLGAPAGEAAEIARLMLASAPESPGAGALAVAAWAAHRTGDEDAEHRYARELLARADADGDAGQRLEVIRSVSVRGHPGEACDLIEPCLREHPGDGLAAEIYAEAVARAYGEAEPGERERAALARHADRSGIDGLRAAIGSFLDRTDWGESVRKRADADRAALEQEYWQPADRAAFDGLAFELAIKLPADGVDGEELPGPARADDPADTVLRAFAADPQVLGELAARASAWDDHVHYGVWQLPDPVAAPGVWCTDLVSGTRRYAQFPASALDGAAPWTVWLGALVPVDGIWRSTGNGIRLSPVEGDAVAEFADQAARLGIQLISGVPRDQLPEPGSMSIRFGQAEPYCVRWETGETPEAEFAEFASAATAGLITRLASQVWWKRATPLRLENTDGDPMLLIDATITVRGDVTGRLLAHPDFAEEDGEDGQIVWWGERVPDPSRDTIVMHARPDGTVELLDPDDEAERWVLGRVTPGEGRIRVRVNSQRRLRRLMRILAAIGVEPQATEEKQAEPSLDFAWGPVPDNGDDSVGDGAYAREWEANWLDQAVAALNFRTPRQAAQGDAADTFRVEALLRQLEYQAGLATTRGERGIDVTWLRAELGRVL